MNKYIKAANQLITPIDIMQLSTERSIYEFVTVLASRAKQINNKLKDELAHYMEEVYVLPNSLENTNVSDIEERVKISKQYEKMPKPLSIAIEEFCSGDIIYRINEQD
jgi:DNA-directed RNA polymerase subunit K/omega